MIPMLVFRADDIYSFFKKEYKFIDEHETLKLKRYDHGAKRVNTKEVDAVQSLINILSVNQYYPKRKQGKKQS